MRKAIFLSGHLRYNSEEFVRQMKNKFHADIFLATWDREECTPDAPLIDAEKTKAIFNAKTVEISNFNAVLESAVLKNRYFEKYRKFDASCHKNRQGHDSFCMFHILKRAWMLLKDYEQRNGFRYDTVIRFRPDYVFTGLPIDFSPKPGTVYFPQNSVFMELTDNLFIADRNTMEVMMTLPDLMDTYLLKESATWCHEHLIDHQLKAHGLNKEKLPTLHYKNANGEAPGMIKLEHQRQKIVATMLVRNEEDILAECLEHNFANGVDEVILMDNASTDRTREIAATFKNVHIVDEPSNEYRQDLWQSRMGEMALERGASWVVPIDGDEFWCGMENLRMVQPNFGAVLADCLYEHPPTDLIEEPFSTKQMPIYHRHDRKFGKWCSGRFAYRPYKGIKIGMGQDNIIDYAGAIGLLKEMWLHHYPIRGYERYAKKIKIGTEAIEAGNHHPFVGSHWKESYRLLKEGKLREVYDNKVIRVKGLK
jgi:hypothetical protein